VNPDGSADRLCYTSIQLMEASMPNGVYRDSGGWVQVNFEGRFRIPMHRTAYEDHDYKPRFEALPTKDKYERIERTKKN
jgi:hypothetical protein